MSFLPKRPWRWFHYLFCVLTGVVTYVCGALPVVYVMSNKTDGHEVLGGSFLLIAGIVVELVGFILVAIGVIGGAGRAWSAFKNHARDQPRRFHRRRTVLGGALTTGAFPIAAYGFTLQPDDGTFGRSNHSAVWLGLGVGLGFLGFFLAVGGAKRPLRWFHDLLLVPVGGVVGTLGAYLFVHGNYMNQEAEYSGHSPGNGWMIAGTGLVLAGLVVAGVGLVSAVRAILRVHTSPSDDAPDPPSDTMTQVTTNVHH
jgi:hypothetical protein